MIGITGIDRSHNYILVSDTIQVRADTETTVTTSSLTLKKRIRILHTGTVRIKFSLKHSTGSANIYGYIYKNGVSILSHNTSSTTYQQFSDDVSVTHGDIIELYIELSVTSGTGYAKNFRICYDEYYSKTDVVLLDG